jgi:hypothetical protein
MDRRSLLLALATAALTARPARAQGPLDRLFGVFVGVARVEDGDGRIVEQRDLDLTIEPFRRTGFRLRTISVTLVDGRRDLPGVVRREGESLFVPAQRRPYFVEFRDPNLFRQREEFQPMAGDPVRWAAADEEGLHVYAFVLLEDGRFELQVTHRRPTAEGLDLAFARIVEGIVQRRVIGRAVRVR